MKTDKKLPLWRVIRTRNKAEHLTTLRAPDAKTAEDTVARDRGITDALERAARSWR
jgi:hypothetical protein